MDRRTFAQLLVVSLAGLGALVGPLACGSDDSGGGAVPVGSACSAFVAQVCPTQAQECQADGACTACESDVTQSACHFGVFAQVAACACATTGSVCQTECAAYQGASASGGSGPGAGGHVSFGGSGPGAGGNVSFGGSSPGDSVLDQCSTSSATTEACQLALQCEAGACGSLGSVCGSACSAYATCLSENGCSAGPSVCASTVADACETCIQSYSTCAENACGSQLEQCSSSMGGGDDGGEVEAPTCEYIVESCCPTYDARMGGNSCATSYGSAALNASSESSCQQALGAFQQSGDCGGSGAGGAPSGSAHGCAYIAEHCCPTYDAKNGGNSCAMAYGQLTSASDATCEQAYASFAADGDCE